MCWQGRENDHLAWSDCRPTDQNSLIFVWRWWTNIDLSQCLKQVSSPNPPPPPQSCSTPTSFPPSPPLYWLFSFSSVAGQSNSLLLLILHMFLNQSPIAPTVIQRLGPSLCAPWLNYSDTAQNKAHEKLTRYKPVWMLNKWTQWGWNCFSRKE